MLPHHSGAEAHSDQDNIVQHIKDGRVEDWIRKNYPKMESLIQWEGVLCIGESAGAHWVVYAWLKQVLSIKAVYIMYGLLVPYSRKRSDEYRGDIIGPEDLKTIGLMLLQEAALKRPQHPQNRGACPPVNMANLPITAVRVLAKRNGEDPKLETLWKLLWSHPMALDYVLAMYDTWLAKQGESSHLEGIQKSEEDVSEMVVIEVKEILDFLGSTLIGRLGIKYDEKDRALSYSVPDTCIECPAKSPTWFLLHDENDPFVPIKGVEIFSTIIQHMYGNVVRWKRVTGSQPLHGFDDYPGSKQVTRDILDEMEWAPRTLCD